VRLSAQSDELPCMTEPVRLEEACRSLLGDLQGLKLAGGFHEGLALFVIGSVESRSHGWDRPQRGKSVAGPSKAAVTQSGTPALSQAGLYRVLDAYLHRQGVRPAEKVDTRGNALLLGRSRSAVLAKIQRGQIPQPGAGEGTWWPLTPRRRHELPSQQGVRPADPLNPKPLPRVRCTLGVAADLKAENRGRLDRDFDAGLNESLCSATAPFLAHVLGIIHVAASHPARV
jgi:hypothetical protein